jgi:hypothetical protein
MQPKLAVEPAIESVIELSEDQLELVGQMNDLAYENQDKTFEELLHPIAAKFQHEASFDAFLASCREVFERERQS